MVDTVRTFEEVVALGTPGVPRSFTYQDWRDAIVSIDDWISSGVAGVQSDLNDLSARVTLRSVDCFVSNSELLDLVANPLVFGEQPNTSGFLDVVGIAFVCDRQAAGYTGQRPAVRVASDLMILQGDWTVPALEHRGVHTSVDTYGPSVEGQRLMLVMPGGVDLAGGDPANSLSLRVYYRIEPAIPFPPT